MPYDDQVTIDKIELLELATRKCNAYRNKARELLEAFGEIQDIVTPEQTSKEQDKNPDGTPKFDGNGRPVLIDVVIPEVREIPKDRRTFGGKFTDATRSAIQTDAVAGADKLLVELDKLA